jgi:NMD protein affecting ribosome stability and mRNA decay
MKKGVQHGQPKRFDRQLADEHNDPYRPKKKLPQPTVCPQCGIVFDEGRWQAMARPAGTVHEHLCPACHRINDRYPAGYVTLKGDFADKHRGEIMKLVRNTEERERGEHALQRIMEISEDGPEIAVTTTDVHLARRIGEAISRAYEGNLDIAYGPEDYVVRVTWSR